MKKIISSVFIVCLTISSISFADNRNERVELMKDTYKEYDNIKKCIGEYVYEQAKHLENDPFQIAMEALSICDDSIEAARMFNRKYIKLAISGSEREKGKMLYMADKQFLEQKEEWINNIQNNINNIRNLDN